MRLFKKSSQHKIKVKDLQIQFTEKQISDTCRKIEESLRTGMLVASKQAEHLEFRMKQITGAHYAVACANGGSALEMVFKYFRSIDPVEKKKVLVPTNTFAATALAVERAGYEVEFGDLDPETFGLDYEKALVKIMKEPANYAGVCLVHIGGFIDPKIAYFVKALKLAGVWVIEDCAHAIGSTYNGKHAGLFSQAGTFSFFATKTVGSAEGGVVITDNAKLMEFCNREKNYGKKETWKHEIVQKGWNNRISEFSAALINVLLDDLLDNLKERDHIADEYMRFCRDNHFEVVLPKLGKNTDRRSWYKFIVLVEGDARKWYDEMLKLGVKCPGTVFDPPLHQMPVFGVKDEGFENANKYCRSHVCLPIYRGLEDSQIRTVCDTLITVRRKLIKT